MFKFQKPDQNKLAEKQRISKEAEDASQSAVEAARLCLNSELFSKYQKAYKNAEEILIKELILIDQTEVDPVRYGFRVKDVVATLNHIGNLLRQVKQDAGKN